VQDTSDPTFTAPPNTTIYKDASCQYNADPSITGDVTNEADNCDTSLNATYTDAVAAGSCQGEQIITRTWSLTDACGNNTTHTQTITARDNTAPTFTAPPNTTIYKDASCGYNADPSITGDVTNEADNCDTTLNATYTDAVGAGICQGEQIITRTWSLTDDCGNTTTHTQTITAKDNTAPIITSVTGPTGPVAIGGSASVTVNFMENCAAMSTATFDWDDGTQSTATGTTSATGTHTYASAGVYTVTVTVTDACGNTSAVAKYEFIVVYDPSSGFVTGGGWIMTAAGSYPANPLLSGRANFGFVSKYKKGQSIPTGETEFQFQAAGFNFHSSAYYWLVVAGCKAQYKGTGTVNGVPGYEFLLTAYDGNAGCGNSGDKFRIKIWNSGGVVYDNKIASPDDIDTANPQLISGGSIVIHK
jgi:hypothetical protein